LEAYIRGSEFYNIASIVGLGK